VDDATVGWRPDPYRRHELRYFDGTSWSEHVLDQGTPGVDPTLAVPAPVVPPTGMVPARHWDSVAAPKYRSGRGLSVALTLLLTGAASISLLLAAAYWNRRSLLDQARQGVPFTAAEGRRADNYVALATRCGLLLGLVIFIVLVVFLFRASRDTGLWDRDEPGFGAGWTIGGWFIPVANYIVPYAVVREIWVRTPEFVGPGRRGAPSAPVWLWWGAWVGANFVFIGSRASGSIDGVMTQDLWRTFGSVVLAFASVMLAVVVHRLDQRQARLGQSAPVPAEVS
jgi:Domain of unknown function (DUF4328)/Protein of unknown function (DUF2510)